jgi:hypothetical protein
MRQKWNCLWVFALALANPAWSDEPPAIPGVQQQRVSPKLLREAMNLPEYKAHVSSTTPPPSIKHLQRLSEKLKTNGDRVNHELLQQFIQEHQQLRRQAISVPEPGALINVRCKLIDIDLKNCPPDSILRHGKFNSEGVLNVASADAFGNELDRAVIARHAKHLFDPVLLTTHIHENCHFHQGIEVSRPSLDGSPSNGAWEIGTILDMLVSPIAIDLNRIDLSIELSHRVEPNESNSRETIARRNMRMTVEAKTGETSVVATSWGDQTPDGHRVFLITRVMPRK